MIIGFCPIVTDLFNNILLEIRMYGIGEAYRIKT